jgi:hypothetical protein
MVSMALNPRRRHVHRTASLAAAGLCLGAFVAQAGGSRPADATRGRSAIPVAVTGADRFALVGQIGGGETGFVNTMAVRGKQLFLGIGPRLGVVDVSDPTRPRLVGQSEVLPRAVRGVVLRDHIAYVALADHGVAALDVTDPERPRVLGRAATAGQALGLALDGTLLLVATNRFGEDGKLEVFDAVDPSRLVAISRLEIGGDCHTVAAGAGFAFVACRGVQVVDLADPGRPAIVATVPSSSEIRDVGMLGPHIVVPHNLRPGDWGLDIIDVSNPRSPRVLAWQALARPVSGLAIDGPHIYAALQRGGDEPWLQVIDAGNPAAPRVEAGFRPTGQPVDLVVRDGAGYATYRQKGQTGTAYVGAFDLADPAQPREVGTLDTLGQVQIVAVDGDVLYAAKNRSVGPSRLHAIDVSNPAAPRLLSSLNDTLTEVWTIDVEGGLLYIADEIGGLRVIDATDPAQLHAIGQLAFGADKALIADAEEGFAYVGTGNGNLHIVDVTDPAHPAPVGKLPLATTIWTVAAAHGMVYVAVGDAGLVVVDVQDPRAPQVVATLPGVGWANHIVVRAGLAYVWAGSRVHIVDVRDPASPRLRSSIELPESSWGMAVAGERLFVAEQGSAAPWQGGMRVYDILDPDHPLDLGGVDTPGEAQGIAANDCCVFVADNESGVAILARGAADAPSPTPPGVPWPSTPVPSETPRGGNDAVLLPLVARGWD